MIAEVIVEEPFSAHKLQEMLANVSTDLIKDHLKHFVKNQKLSDNEMDLILRKMLLKKLCIADPKQPKEKKKKKKPKFKVISSSSDSESD